MHAVSVLKVWLERNACFMHDARCAALLKVTRGLLVGGIAALSQIGRHVLAGARDKAGIKCVDRLLGNPHLQSERVRVYGALARWLLSRTPRPWLIIDWSEVCPGHRFVMLKAAVPLGGRALTIYEEVHPLKRHNSPRVHEAFLKRLSRWVPAGCRPIVITDAGFRGPWFRQVESLGWDWLGRVRSNVKVRLEKAPAQGWWVNTLLYRQASDKPTYVGWGALSKQAPYACHLHLYQGFNRGPGRPRKPFRSTLTHQRSRRAAREPWLLATSLSPQEWTSRRVVQAYRKRMQIEETFRDMKNGRWGYGLEYARSRSAARLEILLLIVALAMLATWLTGLAAKGRGLSRRLQANTERKRTVLSIHFLGRRMLEMGEDLLSLRDLKEAASALPHLLSQHSSYHKIVGIP